MCDLSSKLTLSVGNGLFCTERVLGIGLYMGISRQVWGDAMCQFNRHCLNSHFSNIGVGEFAHLRLCIGNRIHDEFMVYGLAPSISPAELIMRNGLDL